MTSIEVIEEKDLNKYKKQQIGKGTSSQCYITDTNEKFKNFRGPVSYTDSLSFLSTDFTSDIFMFPKRLVYLERVLSERCIGYVSDYVEGCTLTKINDNISMRSIVKSVYELEREIIRLTRDGLSMLDMNPSNLIVTPEGELRVIDTDLYYVCDDQFYRDLLRENIKELAASIVHCFYYDRYKDKSVERLVYDCAAYGQTSNTYMLQETVNYLESRGLDTSTVGSFKRSLKKI